MMKSIKKAAVCVGASAALVTAGSVIAAPAQAAGYNGACGGGYHVIDHRNVTGATIYLTYNGSRNCVVTVRNQGGARHYTWAAVGLSSESTWDGWEGSQFHSYAGPVYSKRSAGKCIDWAGGYRGHNKWMWHTHCG